MKTIKNVDIMRTGDYELSTGPITFTKAHLASAVAALADPAVKEPRLAVGHADGRLDGEPAFGKFTNFALWDKGHTLRADLVGVPDWLVDNDVLAAAFPNRSVEGTFGYQGMTGSPIHDFALTRVVLLGVEMPGISTLEDLEVALTGEPEYTLLDESEMDGNISVYAVAAFRDGEPMKVKAKKVSAAINVDDVRREFYTQVSTGDRSNWWANEIQIDPQQVIVCDESSGDTYRVAYAAGASGKVEFSDPVPVEVVYQDKLAASGHKPIPVGTGTVFATAADSRPERKGMNQKQIRAALGLAEDATDEEVRKKRATVLEALEIEDPEDDAEGDEDDDADGDDDDAGDDAAAEEDDDAEDEPIAASKKKTVKVAAGTKKRVKTKVAAAAASGTVIVDAEQFATMQSTLNVLAKGHEKAEGDRRIEVVSTAIKAGKIPPARKDHWIAQMNADPEGTEEVLASLAPVLPLPQTTTGTGAHDADDAGDDNLYDPIRAAVGGRAITASKKGEVVYDPFLKPGSISREA